MSENYTYLFMFRLKYFLFRIGLRKNSVLSSVSDPFSKATITADVNKKLSAKYNEYSFRIEQRSFGQITIVKVRVRLKEDQKSSVKLWYAYKETSSGIKPWDLI